MFPGTADFLEGADPAPRVRKPQALHAFLLASLIAHLAVLAGLPDFLPVYPSPESNVLEVTLLAPRPLPVAPAEPGPAPPEPRLERKPEPSVEQKPRPEALPEPPPDSRPAPAKPAAKEVSKSPPSQGPALPEQDVEVIGSFSVAPSRPLAPVTAAPDPAAEAAAIKVTPPSLDAAYLSNPPPRYPPAARRAGEQGTVVLRVLVLRTGLPSRVDIEKSSGSALLDAAARDAVWGWQFVPARHGGDPVEQWMQVPVRFRLEDPG